MNRVRALLKDRRRSQRGSVLSGVLIMMAFVAIISGALMTELSTNFLLSSNLVNRSYNEATVNSAMEMALNQLQTIPISQGCPDLTPAYTTLNGRQAVPSYTSCWPTVDVRSPQYASLRVAAVSLDGTHSMIPASSQDLYVVGDSAGTVSSFQFGQSSPIWSLNLGTTITGPPMAMQDAACQGRGPCPDTGGPGGSNADIAYLVPIAGGTAKCPGTACVELLGQDVPDPPDVFCYAPAGATVTSRPAGGQAFPQIAYFGDSGGTLHANNATEFSCAQQASATTPGSASIVAGPIVFPNGSRDEIYVVASKGTSSQLLWYTYAGGSSLTLSDTLNLPFTNPVGLAVEKTSAPARVAITFQGGGVAMVTTNSNFDPSLLASAPIGNSFAGAPYWCACPGGPQIGVATTNGVLHVLDTNLNVVASYTAPSAIRTTPSADGVGEWFVAADNGYLYELQLVAGQSSLVQAARYGGGGLGVAETSVQVAGCPAGICVYVGTSNTAYVVSLDARDVVVSACISTALPTCSGANPRLWAKVEIGSAGNKQTVHIQGWSYYSG